MWPGICDSCNMKIILATGSRWSWSACKCLVLINQNSKNFHQWNVFTGVCLYLMPWFETEGMGSKQGGGEKEEDREGKRERERDCWCASRQREINAICLIKLEPVEVHKARHWWRKDSIQCSTLSHTQETSPECAGVVSQLAHLLLYSSFNSRHRSLPGLDYLVRWALRVGYASADKGRRGPSQNGRGWGSPSDDFQGSPGQSSLWAPGSLHWAGPDPANAEPSQMLPLFLSAMVSAHCTDPTPAFSPRQLGSGPPHPSDQQGVSFSDLSQLRSTDPPWWNCHSWTSLHHQLHHG